MEEQRLRAVAKPSVSPPPPTPIDDLIRKNGEGYLAPMSRVLAHDEKLEFLVQGAVPRGCTGLLTGAPFGGKTWIAYALAIAVAQGKPWLGRGKPAMQGPVVILNFDQPTSIVAARLRYLGATDETPIFVHSFGLTKPPAPNLPEILQLPEQEKRLLYALQHIKPVLIIVDSLRQAHDLDEQSSKDMAKVMKLFKAWHRLNKTCVLLVHHTTKAQDEGNFGGARGSGEIFASADWAITIAEEHSLEWKKHRAWEIGKTKKLTFGVADSFHDADTDEEGVEIPLIKRVNVTATTPLPGEMEALATDAVMRAVEAILKDRPGLPCVLFNPIKAASGLDDKMMREALRAARASGALKYIKTSAGRGYLPKR